MNRRSRFAACVAALAVTLMSSVAVRAAAAQATGAASFAETAAKESPELVGMLSKELSSTPAQAAGAAGALFGLAKTKMKPDEFSQVSKAVPGMGSLLKAAPRAGGAAGALSQAAGLASMASAFSKLGLKPDLVAKAIPVLTQFVGKSGGADVAKLLAGALK